MLRRYRTLAFLILILWLAFAVRLIEMRGDDLWLDEAVEFNVANRPLSEVVAADQAMTHDPPLFGLLLNLWMQNGRGDFYLQMLPVFLSVCAVALVFALGRSLFSPAAGLLSALIAAVAPRSVYYGQELNQYALVSLLAVACPLLLERYLSQRRPGQLLAFVGVMAAALFTHYELALYGIALVCVGTVVVARNMRRNMLQSLAGWVAGISTLAVIGAGLLWLYALPQKARLPAEFAPVRFTEPVSLTGEIQQWVSQSIESLRFLFWGFEVTPLHWLTLGLLAIGVVVGLRSPTGRRAVAYWVVALAIGYVAAGFGFLNYANRYVWYAFPLSVLLVSVGLLSLSRRQQSRVLSAIPIGAAAILVILLAARLPFVSGQPFAETELFGDVVQYVESTRMPGDAIYVYYGARQAFAVYASAELSQVAFVEKWSRGTPAGTRQSDVWNVLSGKSRAWLLLSHVYLEEDAVLVDMLDSRCVRLDTFRSINAAGYLYDCASRGELENTGS
jgi:uncharacterized membrane protein